MGAVESSQEPGRSIKEKLQGDARDDGKSYMIARDGVGQSMYVQRSGEAQKRD